MSTRPLTKAGSSMPFVSDDFLKPWNEWFDGALWPRNINIPAVNITAHKNEYRIELAVPGMKKDDFKINVDGNMLTISSEKEDSKEEKNKRFTCKEYNYSSFSRSFTVPEGINRDKIAAKYENGVLKIALPRKQGTKKQSAKHVAVK